jgi:hypothetical protein
MGDFFLEVLNFLDDLSLLALDRFLKVGQVSFFMAKQLVDFFGEEFYLFHKTPKMLGVHGYVTGGIVISVGKGVGGVVAACVAGPRTILVHVAHRHQDIIMVGMLLQSLEIYEFCKKSVVENY